MADKYIHQQDAIDDLHTQLMYRMGSDDMKRRLDDWVTTLPSADVAPVVHGKWTKLFYDGFNCNKCGSTFVIMQGRNNMYYCPNCGAKMDGERGVRA